MIIDLPPHYTETADQYIKRVVDKCRPQWEQGLIPQVSPYMIFSNTLVGILKEGPVEFVTDSRFIQDMIDHARRAVDAS